MPGSDRPLVYVHLLPALIPPGALKGGVAVVVDVLRATTVMVRALASGCDAVVPCGEVDEARAVAASMPPGAALLAGERQGLPVDGFDLGNSPGDFTPEVCRGKTLVMTTTNGTRAILAALDADLVMVAAFSNLKATVDFLRDAPQEIHVVCSGTDGRVSLEDAALAGAIAEGLRDRGFGNDEAEIVRRLWGDAVNAVEGSPEGLDLTPLFRSGRGGRRVRQIGLQADIREAARVDTHAFVARLRPEGMRILRG